MLLLITAILTFLLLPTFAAPVADVVQLNTTTGWQIFPGQGYRYGPSVIINEDGSIDMWLSTSCYEPGVWDYITYRHSKDGGRTWNPVDQVVLRPTPDSKDHFSCCDPGVIKFGGYYYIGYTSTEMQDGLPGHVFIARSKSPTGPFEKWDGKGWGGKPEPLVSYTGEKGKWGCGEPSFVLHQGKLYIYYTWTNADNYTNLAIASDVTRDDWPARIELKGHIATRDLPGEDSWDVKYVDSLGRFIAVSTIDRMLSPNASVCVRQSSDGIEWERAYLRGSLVKWGAHNVGISGTADGHINPKSKNFIAYAYFPPEKDHTGQAYGWGNWPTQLDTITIGTAPAGSPVYAGSSSVRDNHRQYSAPNAIDGDSATIWSSAAKDSPEAQEWLSVKLGREITVSKVQVTPASGASLTKAFKVQISANGADWTDAVFSTSGSGYLRLDKPAKASWVRLTAAHLPKHTDGKYYLQIAEITVQ